MDAEQLERRVQALEQRLRAVEDVAAIQSLKARYAQLVDARYTRAGPKPPAELAPIATEIAALFSEDAVWDGGTGLGVCSGRPAIRERFLEPTLQFSWHYFVKPRIEVDGDTARGTWDILSPCTTREGRAMWMAGVEEDEYVRRDDAWLHSRMRLEVVFMAPHDRGWAKRSPASRDPGSQSNER
jgi:hypothetical protein